MRIKQQASLLIVFFITINSAVAVAKDAAAIKLFAGKACGSCEYFIQLLNKHNIPFKFYNIDETENYKKLISEESRLGLEVKELPALVWNNQLVGGKAQIKAFIKAQLVTKTAAAEQTDLSKKTVNKDTRVTVEKRIEKKFSTLTLFTVALAGFADGINPCAFATVVFLVCCLTATRNDTRKALIVGLSFTFGIFVTYFAIGLGIFHSLFALNGFFELRKFFHFSAILIMLVIGIFMLIDALRVSRGGDRSWFQLPDEIRKKINFLIANKLHTRHWLTGGIALGSVIGLLEFACTGQIYLPTIIYMIDSSVHQTRAYALFLLYNLMFIVPLLTVLFLCVLGFDAKRLSGLFKHHAGYSKFVMSFVFFLMAFILWYK